MRIWLDRAFLCALGALLVLIPVAVLPVRIGPVQVAPTEMLLGLTLLIWMARRLAGARDEPASAVRSEWPVALFLVAALLSLLVTEYPRESLRELRSLIVEPVALYLLLLSAPLSLGRLRWAITGMVLTMLGIAVYALALGFSGRGAVEAEGVNRLLGIYPSPNHFALMLGRLIPFALAALWQPGKARILAAFAVLLLSATLVATFSVGGWVGSAVGVLATVWILAGTRRAFIGVAIVGLLAAASLPIVRVERVVSHLDPARGTSFIRVQLWTASLAMIRDHPVLGIGLDNFLYRYQQEYLPAEAAMEPNLSHPHNWVLNFWLSLGLPGLVAVLGLLIRFAGKTRQTLREHGDLEARILLAGAVGSLMDFLVHGSLDNSYFLPDMALIFWLTMAIPVIAMRARRAS